MVDSPQRQTEPDQGDNQFYEAQSDTETEGQDPQQFNETQQNSIQRRQSQQQQQQQPEPQNSSTGNVGGRHGAVKESRIPDRDHSKDAGNSTLKINVELDLEAEVDLYARVKGDVTVGLL